jgi:hypothetical protein
MAKEEKPRDTMKLCPLSILTGFHASTSQIAWFSNTAGGMFLHNPSILK